MIIRILVIDPADDNNVLVYQVPEGSRNMDLLVTLLDNAGIEHTTLGRPPKAPKPQSDLRPKKPDLRSKKPTEYGSSALSNCDDQEEGA